MSRIGFRKLQVPAGVTVTEEDEVNYIECMIKEQIQKKFNENRNNYKKLI